MPGQALSGPHSCCYFRYRRKWALEDSGSSEPSVTSRNVCDLPEALAVVQPLQEGKGKVQQRRCLALQTRGELCHRLGAPAGQVLQVARPAAPSAPGGGTHTWAHPLVSFLDGLPHPLRHQRGRSAVSSRGSLQMALTGLMFALAEAR